MSDNTKYIKSLFDKHNSDLYELEEESLIKIEELGKEIKQLKAERDGMYKALLLAKEMFIANDLELPHTFEVIDESLSALPEGESNE